MIVQTDSTQELFINPQLQNEQRLILIYLKPLALATVAALLLSFLVAFVSMSFTARLSNGGTKPGNATTAAQHTTRSVQQGTAANRMVLR